MASQQACSSFATQANNQNPRDQNSSSQQSHRGSNLPAQQDPVPSNADPQ